jgi:NitT/TauT family transport system permease protein
LSRVGAIRLAVVIAFVAAVELVCRSGVIDPFTMIAPSAMASALLALIRDHKVGGDLAFTLTNMAASIALAVVLGFVLGAVIHALPRLRRVVDPLLAAYYAVPTFVFYPLLVVILGLNRLPLIVIGAMFGTVGMAVNTIDGIDRIPRVLLKTAHAYRMDAVRAVLLIKLPAATPHLFTGLKLAVTYSMIGVVAGEFILSMAGLGRSIAFAYNDLDNATMYGLLLLLLSITTLVNVVLNYAEGRVYRRWGRI